TLGRVRQTAADLGYVYDSTASAFRAQKSGFVALTLPSVNNANFAETYRAFTDALSGSGVQILLGSTDYRAEKEELLVRQLLTRTPEAIVLTGGHHTDATRSLLSLQPIPVIEIWDLPPEPLGHVVGFSNARSMEAVVGRLAETGRSKLAYIGAEEGADLRGAQRRLGVVSAARAHGLPEVLYFPAGPAPVSMRQGAEAVRAMGDRIRQVDALVCVSDPVAFGVLSECQRLGITVPDDIAVTGFGNFEVAAVSIPSITTVGVDAALIGHESARILERVFSGEADDQPLVMDVGSTLIVGESA
ncbi:MAG: substrate-binding domain-containing protein, partial [Pseudomonadota bacterium]